jgi:GNAT superfamily N-acetyltransferase
MMKCLLLPLVLFMALCCRSAEIVMRTSVIDVSFLKGYRLDVETDSSLIATLSYVKLPLFPWFVLFDFFVYPEYRNKGIGKMLFGYALQEITAKGAMRVYVQPGPCELIGRVLTLCTGQERVERLKKLVSFYSAFNFRPATNTFIAHALCVMYRILGVHEDQDLLMVYCP